MGLFLQAHQTMSVRMSSTEFAILQAKRADKSPELFPARAASRDEKREAALQQQIKDYCDSQCWPYVHSRMDKKTRTRCGTPDFIIFADGGRVLIIEAKAEKGKLSKEQIVFQHTAAKCGHVVNVVRSWAEFMALVKAEVPPF